MSKVSVIVPTYNDGIYLSKAINSVLKQTYQDYEIIVIDDGSIDNTKRLVESHQDNSIKYIYQNHQGVSKARNLGIEKAEGEFISFLDADDYFLPQHLERQISCLEKQPLLGMVSSGWCRVDEKDRLLSKNKPWQVLPKLDLETWLVSRPVLPSAITIRKNWLNKVNGFQEKFVLAQDIDLILRLALSGCKADWSRQVTTCYRTSSSNATNNVAKQAFYFDEVFNDFFSQNDLPSSVARIENKARYNYLKWLAWRLYNFQNYSLMSSYLLRSLEYSQYSKTKTISDWIDYFEHCSLDEGKELNIYQFCNLKEWKSVVCSSIISWEDSEENYVNTDISFSKPIIKKYKKQKVKGFPPDLILPPFTAENNDYSFIEQQVRDFEAGSKSYKLSVSIVIAGVSSFQHLTNTLFAILQQMYPLNLIEVVIVDNLGTIEVINVINNCKDKIKINHIRKDRAFSEQDAQNIGIESAQNDYLIILDKDILPSSLMVEAYMKYFHVSENVVLIGDRKFVDSSQISEQLIAKSVDAAFKLQEGITNKDLHREDDLKVIKTQHKNYDKSHKLKKDRYPFRNLVSSNIALSKKLIEKIGLFDSEIIHWGYRDLEFGYRIYNEGYYFIPVMDAIGGHQNIAEERGREHKNISYQTQKILFEQKCPVDWYRNYQPKTTYEIPKVSIYVPSYNNGQYIKAAVDSVLNQTYTDVEVCICDDGSTDDTLEVLKRNYEDNPKVRWVSQTNGGIGKASNTAVRMCRGMYIGQLDSDDLITPEAVATLVEILDRESYGCVYSSCERIDAEGNYLKDEYSYPKFSREKMMLTSIAHHFRMFRRRDWLRTDGFNEQILNAVDYDMFLKLSEVCAFHHVEKMLYKRRWHGKNTSFVNEKKQSKNTHVVLTYALERMGLAEEWEVYAPDPEKPREVSYRRKHKMSNLFFFPDYRKSNAYQNLLYSNITNDYTLYSGDIGDALEAIKDGLNNVVFHLHWTNYILRKAENITEAEKFKNQFLKNLFDFLTEGGKLIWTVHNVLPHNCPYVKQEVELRNIICAAAQIIHIHSEKSLPEIQKFLNIPEEKVKVVPHGNYVGFYPNRVSRVKARHRFCFSEEETVFLFLGQIRIYKGIEDLIAAFVDIQHKFSHIRLMIAGLPVEPIYLEDLVSSSEIQSKITFVSKYISEKELQWYFGAADTVVLPYQKILTSGSLLNAMSFSRPAIVPKVGMTEEIIQNNYNGFLYEIGNRDSLAEAMHQVAELTQEQKQEMFENAFKSIKHLTWENISQILI